MALPRGLPHPGSKSGELTHPENLFILNRTYVERDKQIWRLKSLKKQ